MKVGQTKTSPVKRKPRLQPDSQLEAEQIRAQKLTERRPTEAVGTEKRRRRVFWGLEVLAFSQKRRGFGYRLYRAV